MNKGKSFEIAKKTVVTAFKLVKANHGTAGIDNISIEEYECDLKNNLYKLWNRMSSGSYFPKPVLGIEIPKKNGGKRLLGIPTVEDRVAQMVVKLNFEYQVEPIFFEDSYGYRPNKSAIDAVRVTRERCWKTDWLIEFDIKGLFDNIDHDLLMKAVRKHTKSNWVILYIERWLKASLLMPNNELVNRDIGTPQGGVISPVLANLFLHYAFDNWITRKHPNNKWARYADDGIIHCKSENEAIDILEKLKKRMTECNLEIHEGKTKIVYCKDSKRKLKYINTSFDFLGYEFRGRLVRCNNGSVFFGFNPAVSRKASKIIRNQIRFWKLHWMTSATIEDLAKRINPVVRGWINYYGKFHKSLLYNMLQNINSAIVRWVKRKYKRFFRRTMRAYKWLHKVSIHNSKLFYHWEVGILPTT